VARRGESVAGYRPSLEPVDALRTRPVSGARSAAFGHHGMSSFLFFPRFLPCPECGGAVDRAAADDHVCDPERRLGLELFQVRVELAHFEQELAEYLATPAGRFAVYYAERERLRTVFSRGRRASQRPSSSSRRAA